MLADHAQRLTPGDNAVIDLLARACTLHELSAELPIPVLTRDFSAQSLRAWVAHWYPHHPARDYRHKKTFEFFVTCQLLQPGHEDVLLDVGGAQRTYIDKTCCRRKIVQDVRIAPAFRAEFGDQLELVEGNAARIDLASGSVTRIACHHAFEHFQADADMGFIEEIKRLLALGGLCCVVPLLIGRDYIEVTDDPTFALHGDARAHYVVDPSAALSGGAESGSFARIYDCRAFKERILSQLDPRWFKTVLIQPHIDHQPMPDLTLPIHRTVTAVNRPYRALLIERKE